MKTTLLLSALLIAPALLATDQYFPKELCKISAPTGYAWLDPEVIPGALAVAADENEEMLVLLVADAPEGATELSDELIGFLEEGLLSGQLSKISGERINFKDLPAYEMHVRTADDGIVTLRYFIANGLMYQLQIAGCKLPVSARDNLSLIFDRFDFMSKTEAAEAAATMAEMDAEAAAIAEAEADAASPGARNAIIILVALVLFVLVLLLFVIAVRRMAAKPKND